MFGQKPYWLGAEIEFKQIIPKDLSQLRPVPDTLKQFGCVKERIHARDLIENLTFSRPVLYMRQRIDQLSNGLCQAARWSKVFT